MQSIQTKPIFKRQPPATLGWLIIVGLILTAIPSIVIWATVGNDAIALLIIAAVLLISPGLLATASPGAEPAVHMSAGNFTQSSITITKGAKLMLVDDVSIPHILANGTWQNGTPKPAIEPGAPTINKLQVNGNSVEVGPFNTA